MTEPLRFDAFMEQALYGPSGFYQGDGRAGRRGDFITSPEVGPLFGAVVARYLDAEWRRLGEPAHFDVVDVGAGPGTLARSISLAEPQCASAMRYAAVERSPSQRGRHPADIISTDELPERISGVVIANELLDNLPFRLAVFDGVWREAHVSPDADGRWVEHLVPLVDVPTVMPKTAGHGARAPLIDEAHHLVADIIDRIDAGSFIAIDYARPTTAELALRPWRDWLRTYRGHARGGHYLDTPGEQDITIDVPVDQLPEPDAVRSQSQWLQLHGIDHLVAAGRAYWAEHAAQPDLTAMLMRSRISEAEALLDPDGLGGFTVLEWRRAHQRSHRLSDNL